MSVTPHPGKTLSGTIKLLDTPSRTESISHGGTGLFDCSVRTLTSVRYRVGGYPGWYGGGAQGCIDGCTSWTGTADGTRSTKRLPETWGVGRKLITEMSVISVLAQ